MIELVLAPSRPPFLDDKQVEASATSLRGPQLYASCIDFTYNRIQNAKFVSSRYTQDVGSGYFTLVINPL